MTKTIVGTPAEKKRYYNNMPGQFIVTPVEVLLDSRLTDQERRILLCLCRYANSETGKSAPSYETITECTGIARENASRAMGSLVEKGWVDRIRLGRGFPNVYFVTIPKETEFRKVTPKRRTSDEQKKRVAEIQAKISDDNRKAVEEFNRGIKDVYKIAGDPTEYETSEAALAALEAREAQEAQKLQDRQTGSKKPAKARKELPAKAGGIKGEFDKEEVDLEDFKEEPKWAKVDEYAGYTRGQLYDMQVNGVQLPQHIIHKNNLGPNM
ncbi:helix-turn-helix domain-containing protein [Massilia sp. 9096]|uniref:helix-turn-helix domain-containing protein n=1 Tax=Massilia sp. 9096 TaxID=1500894 RepID=UPI00055EFC3C|nr:helix-turn-helix domain-containing protein [Massilia sp. 9096]